MIASPPSALPHLAPQTLQNPLTAEDQAIENSPVVATMIPQAAINEFALRLNVALIEMLNAQGVPNASPLSKKLRAYAAAGNAPVQTTSRFV